LSARRSRSAANYRPLGPDAEASGDLDSLIGLVDQLSGLDPEEIVPQAAGAGAPKAAAAPGGKPPDPAWKWQPKQNRGGRG
jgi:hypothetical protein